MLIDALGEDMELIRLLPRKIARDNELFNMIRDRRLTTLGIRRLKNGDDLVLAEIQHLRDLHRIVEVGHAVARTVVEEIAQEEEDAAFIRRKRQEESRAEEIKRQDAAKRAVIEEDVTSFKQQYPGVDMIALANNPSFRKFCGTRFGVERMTDLYADFKEFVGNVETAAVVKNDGRRQRSTGSGQAGGPVMTVAQKQALAEWNRRNPDLKMTPKEFMSK